MIIFQKRTPGTKCKNFLLKSSNTFLFRRFSAIARNFNDLLVVAVKVEILAANVTQDPSIPVYLIDKLDSVVHEPGVLDVVFLIIWVPKASSQ